MQNPWFSSNTLLPTKQSINLVIPVIVMIKTERITQFGSEMSELSTLLLKYRNLQNASFSRAAVLSTKQSINLIIPVIVMIKIERITQFGSEMSELSNLFLKYRNLKNAFSQKLLRYQQRNQSASS